MQIQHTLLNKKGPRPVHQGGVQRHTLRLGRIPLSLFIEYLHILPSSLVIYLSIQGNQSWIQCPYFTYRPFSASLKTGLAYLHYIPRISNPPNTKHKILHSNTIILAQQAPITFLHSIHAFDHSLPNYGAPPKFHQRLPKRDQAPIQPRAQSQHKA
jgi:hypothetical protein